MQGVGCTTPGSKMLIEDREVRGVPSAGMLCSAWDLGWVPEPDGVLVELPLDLMPGDLCPTEAPADVRSPACSGLRCMQPISYGWWASAEQVVPAEYAAGCYVAA